MAMAELLRAFERETDEAVRVLLAEAKSDASRIEAEATHARDDRMAAAIAEASAARRAQIERDLADSVQRGRGAMLAARALMLERVRAAVAVELPGLLASDPLVGDGLLDAAIGCAGSDAGVLRCAPVIAERARAMAPRSLDVVADPAVETGVIVELATGTRIDATLAHLLDRLWPALACEALERVAMERAPAKGDA